MNAFLLLLIEYQVWIYVIFGLLLLIYLSRLGSAWNEWRSTIFGLERESAQKKVNASLAMVSILLMLLLAEYIIVTRIIPKWPEVVQAPTPAGGVDVPVDNGRGENGISVIISPTPSDMIVRTGDEAVLIPTPAVGTQTSGCIPNELEWIEPVAGSQIDGVYSLIATVNVQDMAFFRYDYAPIADQTKWMAISAGNLPVIEGEIGVWSTTEVEDGDYILRLTVVDKFNKELTPCDVNVRVMNEVVE